MKHIWEFILKLILFGITYYFMLEYIINCKVHTPTGSIITIATIMSITFGYVIFMK